MKPTFCRIDCPPSHFLCCNRDCVPSRVCSSTTQCHPRGAGVPTACLNAAECVQLGAHVAVLRTASTARVPPCLLRKGMPNQQVHHDWAQFAVTIVPTGHEQASKSHCPFPCNQRAVPPSARSFRSRRQPPPNGGPNLVPASARVQSLAQVHAQVPQRLSTAAGQESRVQTQRRGRQAAASRTFGQATGADIFKFEAAKARRTRACHFRPRKVHPVETSCSW